MFFLIVRILCVFLVKRLWVKLLGFGLILSILLFDRLLVLWVILVVRFRFNRKFWFSDFFVLSWWVVIILCRGGRLLIWFIFL